ncbi:Sodium/potassium-transporting ATPase subunit beta family-containing protein [Strongyloides ratti]|uniref:Sodium/potassium-transporting ATPase subunit beta family-containing protein n=1 Tax=Strongyloides ratti TaxID=34506 RepID=A0A090MRN4_STRRB|nr:Sodium/potassium-transporting ATPase subunit beta family-containing protein [Strongyloides ratti]CEF60898.1 Sodium/potassium-transporting ATPase subunit beta family-containing protein [Strongyloides ratti]
MNLSTSSTLKSAQTSTDFVNTKSKKKTKSSKSSLIKHNDENKERLSLLTDEKYSSSKKTISFSKDTDFTTNHHLLKINTKYGENKNMLTGKQLKLRELVKSRITFVDCGKIILFYIILNSFYFIFTLIMFAIFKPSNIDHPIIHGESSFHGYEPKLITIPMTKNPGGKLKFLKFDPSDISTYELYTKQIEKFLELFNDTSNGRNCLIGETNKDVNDGLLKQNKFCMNKQINSITLPDCTTEHDFGFKYGNPCFFLSLNNHLNWIPGNLNETYINENNLNGIDTNHYIPITCHNDDNNIRFKYSDKNGINKKFYPFLNIKGFHKGYVIIQFYDLIPNKEYILTCILHTGNNEKKLKENKVIIRIIVDK